MKYRIKYFVKFLPLFNNELRNINVYNINDCEIGKNEEVEVEINHVKDFWCIVEFRNIKYFGTNEEDWDRFKEMQCWNIISIGPKKTIKDLIIEEIIG